MSQQFVLATRGDLIQLVYGEFKSPELGQYFERDALTGKKGWTIVRVFEFKEQRRLEALAELIGHDALSKLFECRPLGY